LTRVEPIPGGIDVEAGMLIDLNADVDKVRAELVKQQSLALAGRVRSVEIGKKEFFRIETGPRMPPITWGTAGRYLIVAVGEGTVERIIDRAKTAAPDWVVRLHKQEGVTRVASVGLLDVTGIVEASGNFIPEQRLRPLLEAIDLDGVQRITSISGLDEEGSVSRVTLKMDGAADGAWKVFAGRELTAADFAGVPADATFAAVASFDAAKIFAEVMKSLDKFQPGASKEVLKEVGRAEEQLGFRIREDLLEGLGDRWKVYSSPSEGGLLGTGAVVVVDVRDREKFVRAYDKVVERMKQIVPGIVREKEYRRDSYKDHKHESKEDAKDDGDFKKDDEFKDKRRFDNDDRKDEEGIDRGVEKKRDFRGEAGGLLPDEKPRKRIEPKRLDKSDFEKGSARRLRDHRFVAFQDPDFAEDAEAPAEEEAPPGDRKRSDKEVEDEGEHEHGHEHSRDRRWAERMRRREPKLQSFEFAGQTIYYVRGIRDVPIAPSFCLTDDKLIIALYPQPIKAILTRPAEFKSLAEEPRVKSALARGGTSMLLHVDTKDVAEKLYPLAQLGVNMAINSSRKELPVDGSIFPAAGAILPHLDSCVATCRTTSEGVVFEARSNLPMGDVIANGPMIAGTLVPAIINARKAARRAQTKAKMLQIGIAMQAYQTTHGHFPPAYTVDKDGKPLHSWRVLLLPYLEHSKWADAIKMDEPWDSEHNRKLLRNMPEIYRSPASEAPPNMTTFQVPSGDETMFQGGKKIRRADVRDGSSNTILLVETNDDQAVHWAKPEDWKYDPDKPAKGVIDDRSDDGFVAVFADSSVRFISRTIDRTVLKGMFTRAGGEPLGLRSEGGFGDRRRFEKPAEDERVDRKDAREAPRPAVRPPIDKDAGQGEAADLEGAKKE